MEFITIEVLIDAPLASVWKQFISPEAVEQWNHASDDWHTPHAINDFQVGGSFNYRMEAKDGSFGFNLIGVYDQIEEHQSMVYFLEDGRSVNVSFEAIGDQTNVVEVFEPEIVNPIELQRQGWQQILTNFKLFVENLH
jgi:uncharacterized protein YndB with AHSA1/START domain